MQQLELGNGHIPITTRISGKRSSPGFHFKEDAAASLHAIPSATDRRVVQHLRQEEGVRESEVGVVLLSFFFYFP
ncbi:hypothetical protein Q1695_005745 [Nippostrongylus brasiliensis]|nr:hypothetical protein Q1695_005745 [Nippostrongylus brasiliensis]